MANFACPSCRQISRDVEIDSPCLFCGQPLNQVRHDPVYLPDGIDVRAAARYQRWLLRMAPVVLGIQLLWLLAPGPPGLRNAIILILVASSLAAVAVVTLLMVTLRSSELAIVGHAALAWVPFLNLAIIMGATARASAALEKAGVRVAWLGVSDRAVRHLLEAHLCNECGYNLTGNTSGRCSECGTKIRPR